MGVLGLAGLGAVLLIVAAVTTWSWASSTGRPCPDIPYDRGLDIAVVSETPTDCELLVKPGNQTYIYSKRDEVLTAVAFLLASASALPPLAALVYTGFRARPSTSR